MHELRINEWLQLSNKIGLRGEFIRCRADSIELEIRKASAQAEAFV
jgi:hypothetical protein